MLPPKSSLTTRFSGTNGHKIGRERQAQLPDLLKMVPDLLKTVARIAPG
jgi:hypothetical protein